MAIQFNLLPDVKMDYSRQQRAKHLIYTISMVVCVGVIAVVTVAFLSVNVLQKKLLDDAQTEIKENGQRLKSIPDLDKILTVQNQLNSLPNLHDKKHYTSRLFVFLPQVTPTSVHIGKLKMDTVASTLTITGTADKVESVNKFVDTLKFTSFVVGDDQATKKPAFSNVLLTKIDRDDQKASYTVDTAFDPALFTGTKNVTLVVPQSVTTRSVIDSPGNTNPLFNGQTGNKQNGEQEN